MSEDGSRSSTRVGRYELLRELGRGGMGRVHLAREPALQRDVALKELGAFAGSADVAARFLREARLAGSLSHPNIVTIYEYFEVESVPYIAMEYLAGGSLRSHLAALDLAGLATVMEGVLAGLAHAGDAGIVHRDLKPENIMVTATGAVKIGDFGLAKATEIAAGDSVATRTGVILGTPHYMAPEQATGGEIGTWSDLYSLGVIAYEQLVGRLPFGPDDGPMAILMRHAGEGLPPAREARPDLDPRLAAWTDWLLVTDSRDRCRDPREAWAQLEEIVLDRLGTRWRHTERSARPPADGRPLRTPPRHESVPTMRSLDGRGGHSIVPVLPTGEVTLVVAEMVAAGLRSRDHGPQSEHARSRGELLRTVWAAHGGVELGATLVAFPAAEGAVRAAADAQRVFARTPGGSSGSDIRIGIHTGAPQVRDGMYWGTDVHYAERLCAAANAGQVLMSATTRRLVPRVEVDDLGERALRDFPAARRIFHLVVDGRTHSLFGAVRAQQGGDTNLPDQISSFVGRERELELLRELVAVHRLVTLVGAGGVGKTRLALRLGAELLDGSGDGVWLAELAPLVDAELVGPTIASALQLPERPDEPVLDTLANAIADRELLVIVDNCEHVIDAAGELIAELLVRCPALVVIATSRQPLGVNGEQVYRVPSLSLSEAARPELADVAHSEAAQLFLERARQQRPEFSLTPENAPAVARICRRLDGIALAIELAAVRLRSLSVSELESRLDQRLQLLRRGKAGSIPRQQTLEALIDWSFRLLSDPEQKVLVRLSVFAAGGFDLGAAEAVCVTETVDEFEMVDHLDALVDKSLVQAEDTAGEIRYRLLETVREYAAALLRRSPQAAAEARAAHRDHYLRLAEATRPHLYGPDATRLLNRLQLEHDNMRQALAWCLEDADPSPGLRLAAALRTFCQQRGFGAEGARTLDEHLARPESRAATRERGAALATRGLMQQVIPLDAHSAVSNAEEALKIAHACGDDEVSVLALRALSTAQTFAGKHEQAGETAERGLALARLVGDWQMELGFVNAGAVAAIHGADDPRPALREALEIARLHGDRFDEAVVLGNLGVTQMRDKDPDVAREFFDQALTIFSDVGDPSACLWVTYCQALACCADDDWTHAAGFFRQVLASAVRLGEEPTIAGGLSGLAITAPDTQISAVLYGAALAIHERLKSSYDDMEQRAFLPHQKRVQEALGTDRYEQALQSGRRLSRREAIAIALRDVSAHEAKPNDP